ncbi:MAG: type II toxin-antitoxin system RelE/ParE family toxin [candidate division NC10 bacterium]|nr:type II toxin-antitoxin system RelE/ParE family toxin [candidate division NC10 bacterium]
MKPQKTPLTKVIHAVPGAKIRVEAVVLDDGSCPAEEFLNHLGELGTAKMKGLFDLFVRTYPRHLSDQKFKRIEGTDLFEFKSFQIRMPCFFSQDGRVLLAHGLIKKTDKLQVSDVRKAREIKASFERRVRPDG